MRRLGTPCTCSRTRLQNRAVTCAEYLAFMDDNGYDRAELWLSEGWDTVERERWQAPLYWQRSTSDRDRLANLHDGRLPGV